MPFSPFLETCTLVLLGVYGREVVVFEMDGEMVEVWLKQDLGLTSCMVAPEFLVGIEDLVFAPFFFKRG